MTPKQEEDDLGTALEARGYRPSGLQYADNYVLEVKGAGAIRVVLWKALADHTQAVVVRLTDERPNGGKAEIKIDPLFRNPLPFLAAMLDAAEAQLSGSAEVVPAAERA
jgi:hypothetical protein